MNNIQQSILKTIAYFDIFSYPLTLIELHKWLFCDEKISFSDLNKQLNYTPSIEEKNGLYFLKGNKNNIQTRLQRYLIAEKKFKKRKKIIRLLCAMPHVKMIAICNSLSFSNAREKSDIDLFIITDKKYSWTTRFFTTTLITLLKLRPTQKKTRDTICLSFFTSENNIDFLKLQSLDNDIYIKYWITKLLPIYDADNYFQKFIDQNQWVKQSIANWLPQHTIDRRTIKLNPIEKIFKNFLELFSFDLLYKKIQLKALSKNLKNLQNKDTRVIINDSMLKLYPLDRRQEYYNEWQKRIKKLGIS